MAELNVGDEIAELRVTPDKYLPHRYAGASGDFNPIHIDPEFAKAVGLPNTILHGLYMMGLVARASTEAGGGDPGALKRLSVQFRGMGAPETEIVVSGRSSRSRTARPRSTWSRRRVRTRRFGTPRRKFGCSARAAGPVAAALPHVLGRRFAAPSAMGDPRHRATRGRDVSSDF